MKIPVKILRILSVLFFIQAMLIPSLTFAQITGNIKITIYPLEARNAGAQWEVYNAMAGGDGWIGPFDSGHEESSFYPTSTPVRFTDIDGWDTPPDITVDVVAGETAIGSGTYIQQVDTTKPSGMVFGIDSSYVVGNTISCTLTGEDDIDLSTLTFQIHADTNADGTPDDEPTYGDIWDVSGTSTEKSFSASTSEWNSGSYQYFYWVDDAAGLYQVYTGEFSLLDSDDSTGDSGDSGDSGDDSTGDSSTGDSGDSSTGNSGDSSTGDSGNDSTGNDSDDSIDNNDDVEPPPPPPQQYTVDVAKNGAGSGTVTSLPSGINCGSDCSESYDEGTNVTLQANPDSNSSFTGWNDNDACNGMGDCELSMISDQDVTATFEPSSYTLTVTVSGEGTVTNSLLDINCDSECSYSFDVGKEVTLTANSEEGLVFAGWSGACNGSEDCVVSMTSPQNVTATFKPVRTLIITNYEQFKSLYNQADADNLMAKLEELAKHPDVDGSVIKVEEMPNVALAYKNRTDFNNKGQANTIAEAIKSAFLGKDDSVWNTLENVVIVGDDRIVPFHRIIDGSRKSYHEKDGLVLINDFYADRNLSDRNCNDPRYCSPNQFKYIPDVAIGRLVESPLKILGIIDTFLNESTLNITLAAIVNSSSEAAIANGSPEFIELSQKQCESLKNKGIVTQTLIDTPFASGSSCQSQVSKLWTVNDFKNLLNSKPNIISINAHADYNLFGTPDKKTITPNDINSDFANTIFYTIGCHAGKNVIGKADFPEIFLEKKANYIANTGFGIGYAAGLGPTEKVMLSFTKNLADNTIITIGEALKLAKIGYWSKCGDGNCEKAITESTLYGLPMYKVTSPTTTPTTNTTSIITASNVGSVAMDTLQKESFSFSWPILEPVTSSEGSYYPLDGNVTGDDGKPVLPEFVYEVTQPQTTLHGVVFTGGSYSIVDTTPPLQQIVITDGTGLNETATGDFKAPNWYPATFFTHTNLELNAGNIDSLVATAGQYNPNQTVGQQRIFTNMDFDMYYHVDSDDWTAPTTNVESIIFQGESTSVTVTASDTSGVQAVLVTFTDGEGTWNSVELTQQEGETWQGSFTAKPQTQFFVQGVDKAGNVLVNDNDGKYFDLFSPLVIVAKETGHNKVAIVDAEGELLNSFETESSGNDISIDTGDFDGDGEDEVVVNVDKQVLLYKLDGTNIYDFSIKQEGDIATGDYDGDGLPEFFTTSKAANTNSVSIHAYDGTLLNTVNIDSLGKNTKLSIEAIDIDGDDMVEIIAGDLKGDQVAIYRVDGTEINTFAVFQEPNTRRTRKSDKSEKSNNSSSNQGNSNAKPKDNSNKPEKDNGNSNKPDKDNGNSNKPDKEKGNSNKPDKDNGNSNKPDKDNGNSNKPDKDNGNSNKPDKDKGNSDKAEKEKGPNGKTYGVKVAAGDLDGDGEVEIIVGSASKINWVQVYTVEGELKADILPDFSNNKGVEIAAGDIDKDGADEIIIGDTAGTQVQIYDGDGTFLNNFAGLDEKNIASIAFGKGAVEIVNPLPVEEPSTTSEPVLDEPGETATDDAEPDEYSEETSLVDTDDSTSEESPLETSVAQDEEESPQEMPVDEDEEESEGINESETTTPADEADEATTEAVEEMPSIEPEAILVDEPTTEVVDKDETPLVDETIEPVTVADETTEDDEPLSTEPGTVKEEITEVTQPSENMTDEPPPVDNTITTDPIAVSSQPPTTGEINRVEDYQGDTISNATIGPDGNISNATLAGEISNEGMLSNGIVLENATLEGGTVSGDLDNQGTVKDITFVGHQLEGGDLGGTITVAIDEPSLGIIKNVSLLPDTVINGGQLTGQIQGPANGKAKLNAVKIRKAKLTNVIIGADCELAENVILGEGVRFIDNATIPEDTDLTEALSTDDNIDITTDVVIEGPSLLEQINDLPDMQANDWELVQNQDSGKLEVMVDGIRLVIKPKQVKQAKRNRKAQINIHGDGTVTVITAQGREILVQIQ